MRVVLCFSAELNNPSLLLAADSPELTKASNAVVAECNDFTHHLPSQPFAYFVLRGRSQQATLKYTNSKVGATYGLITRHTFPSILWQDTLQAGFRAKLKQPR